MKKETSILHSQIANDTLYYIYEYLDSDININELANDFNLSKYHFHRIFKEQIGCNIYETIKSIRLQKASNLLLSNRNSTIFEIAKTCGYQTSSAFIRAFKARFKQTPKQWRNGDYKKYSSEIINKKALKIKDFSHLRVNIVRTSPKKIFYIRGKLDYQDSLMSWQKLITWVYSNKIEDFQEIGVYHNNPVLIKPKESAYVASIAVPLDLEIKNPSLPCFFTTEDVCACFELEGKQRDLLAFLQWVYLVWLPNSGYETTAKPSYTIMKKNHFLSEDGSFKLKYYIPIRYL